MYQRTNAVNLLPVFLWVENQVSPCFRKLDMKGDNLVLCQKMQIVLAILARGGFDQTYQIEILRKHIIGVMEQISAIGDSLDKD